MKQIQIVIWIAQWLLLKINHHIKLSQADCLKNNKDKKRNKNKQEQSGQ